MPTVVYAEPGDEIADVVQRVRQTADPSIALVLPSGVPAFHSPLNVRLLAQFAAREGHSLAIITGDPRVQTLAREARFPTYASVQAYERGIELVQPHTPGLGAVEPISPRVAGPVAAAPGPRRPPGFSWSRRRPLIFAALGALVVGALLFLLVVPSAKVTVTIGATQLTATPTIEGSTDPATARQGDHILTQVVTADAANRFTATPTGVQVLPPAAATGQVVFTTDLPFGASFTIQKGEAFQTGDNPPIVFYATQDVPVTVPAPTSPGQRGAGSNPVPVQDGTPEARGNVPAGAIGIWPRNPCNPDPSKPRLCSPSDLSIGNPAPTTGGAAEKRLTIVSDTDLQNFRNQVEAMKKPLTDTVGQAMSGKAPNMQFAVDDSGNGRSFSTDITPALPQMGNQYSPTTITVTVHGRGTVFSPDDVRRALVADLTNQVPQGESLAAEQLTITPPKITQAGDDGAVVMTETASGFSRPTVTLEGLKSSLTGKSPDDVRLLIEHRIGRHVIRVDINQQPFSWFLLPFFSSRIDLVENFVATKSSA